MTIGQILLGILFGILGVGFALFVLAIWVFMTGIVGDPIEHIDE